MIRKIVYHTRNYKMAVICRRTLSKDQLDKQNTLYMLMHTYMHSYMHAYMHTYSHTCIHRCKHRYTHTCTHTHMHAYMLAYMHTYIHAYIHTYIHNTRIHKVVHPRASLHEIPLPRAIHPVFPHLTFYSLNTDYNRNNHTQCFYVNMVTGKFHPPSSLPFF